MVNRPASKPNLISCVFISKSPYQVPSAPRASIARPLSNHCAARRRRVIHHQQTRSKTNLVDFGAANRAGQAENVSRGGKAEGHYQQRAPRSYDEYDAT